MTSANLPNFTEHVDRVRLRELHSTKSVGHWAPGDEYKTCAGCGQQIDRVPCNTIMMLDYIDELEEDLKLVQQTLERSMLPERR